MTVFDDTLTDNVAVTPAVEDIIPVLGALTDNVAVTPTVADIIPFLGVLVSTVTIDTDIDDSRLAELAALVESVDIGSELEVVQGVLVRERAEIADPLSPALIYGKLLTEAAQISELIRRAETVALEDALTLETTFALANAWAVADELQLGDTLVSLTNYAVTLADAVRIRDALDRFFGADLSETISISNAWSVVARLTREMAEGATFTGTAENVLLLAVTSEEELAVSDTELLQMIFAGDALSDTVSIEAMSVDPGAGVVTWCVNTRQGFVTEYRDYDFNSFAAVGGKYVGATSEGLYDLEGDTDDGEQIIASIASGLLQMNSSRLHGLGGVYIGLRGAGEFYLKLTTGDGVERVYRVTARDMETTKVNVGKGLRHRYMSYSLENVGQEFELESIEFVPMRAFRRV